MYEMVDGSFAVCSAGRRDTISKVLGEGIRVSLLECVNIKGIVSHGNGENPSYDKERGEFLCGKG